MKTRATVVIRQRDRDSDDGYAREWVHEDEPGPSISFEEDGVWLRWPEDFPVRTFIPWASVVRIDFGPCNCFECVKERRQS